MRTPHFALALLALLLTPLAHADGKVFCTYANNSDWASGTDLNAQITTLRKTESGVVVSAPSIASASPHDNYPNFEMCVSASYGAAATPTQSQILCSTGNSGAWATPDSINATIAQLEKAGKHVDVSAPAVTLDAGDSGYPNVELCVTVQY